MNFERARSNMIEQQIRTWEVLDYRVLDLLAKIHREDFVPPAYRRLALADIRIPLAHGQVTMTPKMEARVLQSLALKSSDKVLEIGTGCAYMTALLTCMAQTVTSVDIFPEFTREAEEKLSRAEITNVTLENGDAVHGWNREKSYNVIVVTGSLPELSDTFLEQLDYAGRLFVIVGQSPVMSAQLITRTSASGWTYESLFETDFPALIGAETGPRFSL